jgi:DNA-binding NarL/FixJ family response regulator
MQDQKIPVVVVAGNRLLREALAKLLGKKSDCDVRGVLACTLDVTTLISSLRADVLILDSVTAHPPDCTLISEIAEKCQDIRILLIDMEDDPQAFLQCIRAGAVGYLLKDASAADVISAVRAVAQGQAVCPPQFCMTLFKTVAKQWTLFPSVQVKLSLGLTRRQQQLVPLIEQGLTNKEIASCLNISEQTVKNHVHRMLRRVGANDRLAVVDLARQYPLSRQPAHG